MAVLFLFGILVWVYLQTARKDYTQYAVKFDSALSEILVAEGITDANILSQSRVEKASGTHIWVEYFKEISVPGKSKADKLSAEIIKLADRSVLNCSTSMLEGAKTRLDVTFNQVLLHSIILSYPPSKTAKESKKVAIVIDDLGYTKDISGLLGLGVPITFAILPREPYSKQLAERLTAMQRPFILHMPLEPEGYPKINPGKAAILRSMTAKEIRSKFEANLASVPGVRGVSNHMGSAFSADKAKMRIFLELVKEKKLFYFDSYTTPKTQAGKTAKEIGLPFLENRVFLDSEDEPAAVRKQLGILLRQAQKNGRSIAIGHIDKKNVVPALKEYIPKFREQGVEFVYLTDLLKK